MRSPTFSTRLLSSSGGAASIRVLGRNGCAQAVEFQFAGLLAFLLLAHAPATAGPEVDVALVLAVDISNSMDAEEQALQREGFIAAFRSPLVHDAIRKGAHGRVAVTYMEWAGTVVQQVVIPWAVIENSDEALQVCGSTSRQPRSGVLLAPRSRRPSTSPSFSSTAAGWRPCAV